MKQIFSLMLLSVILAACGQKTTYDPYNVTPIKDSVSVDTKDYFEVEFKKTPSQVKTIHIKLNDVVSKDALFDTGCSDMLISSLEVLDLLKEGAISYADSIGVSFGNIADGSTIVNEVYNIREVSIIDKNGKPHVLHDVAATVVDNLKADILVGTSLIDNWATHSYTVDLEHNVIRFQ